MSKAKIRLVILSVITSLGLAFSSIPAIYASTYGSGNYGACTYGNGCPAASSSSGSGASAPTSTSSSTPGQILLNDYPEYVNGAGKELTLQAGQVVYFNVQTNGETVSHNITIQIQSIGPDYVDIVFQPGSTTVRFQLGQTRSFDVDGDGKDDIKITLVNLNNGQATFIFSAVLGANVTKVTPSATTIGVAHHSLFWIILFIIIILVALFIFFLLWRRRKEREEQPGPR